MPDSPSFTGEQVALAARELRQAAGADEETFSTEQVLSMLGEELRLLRERGFTPAQIADLLTGFDIPVTPEQIVHRGPTPRFVE